MDPHQDSLKQLFFLCYIYEFQLDCQVDGLDVEVKSSTNISHNQTSTYMEPEIIISVPEGCQFSSVSVEHPKYRTSHTETINYKLHWIAFYYYL